MTKHLHRKDEEIVSGREKALLRALEARKKFLQNPNSENLYEYREKRFYWIQARHRLAAYWTHVCQSYRDMINDIGAVLLEDKNGVTVWRSEGEFVFAYDKAKSNEVLTKLHNEEQ